MKLLFFGGLQSQSHLCNCDSKNKIVCLCFSKFFWLCFGATLLPFLCLNFNIMGDRDIEEQDDDISISILPTAHLITNKTPVKVLISQGTGNLRVIVFVF